MKYIVILIAIIILPRLSYSQSVKKIVEEIKNDTAYFYGQGSICDSYDAAMNDALEKLYVNMSGNIDSFVIIPPECNDNQTCKVISTFNSEINEVLIPYTLQEDDYKEMYQYFLCIKRSDFRKMCINRLNDIQKYVNKGYKMEEEGSIEDALKSYYWALVLCYAHPQGRKITFNVEEENHGYEWIIDRIDGNDGILRSFNFLVPKNNAIYTEGDISTLQLFVTTKEGSKVNNLSCDCHNGIRFVPNTVRDGKLFIQLVDNTVKNIRIKVNYTFADDAKKMNPSVYKAMEVIKIPRFTKNNVYFIDLDKTIDEEEKTQEPPLPVDNEEPGWKDIAKSHSIEKEDYSEYLNKMRIIENALRMRKIELARDCFSDEGYGMFDTLSKYGKMTLVGKPDYKFLRYNDEVLCRSITLQFDFRNTVGFSQDVVFRFDTLDKVVTSIAFRLSDVAEKDIVSKVKWPEESRLLLINFLEDYQTAYALKRKDFLNAIYSDDALIIVGRVVKRTVIPDRMSLKMSDEEVRYSRYDKQKYLENLNKCFLNQDYIRLRFTETDFTKASGRFEKIYGVRVRQEYSSSTYGDVGYLFLLVDLRKKTPQIHVRTWQPDKVDLEKLIELGRDVRFE
ncbi:MAG: hypothetical protein ACI358_01650 [Candidatus Limimorpha sp.]